MNCKDHSLLDAKTYDTQQFVTVRLWRINTLYSDKFKIKKLQPFHQQRTVLLITNTSRVQISLREEFERPSFTLRW